MIENPFEVLLEQVQRVQAQLAEVLKAVARPSAPVPEWEAISTAMVSRKKSRATLLAAVDDGRVERRVEPSRGGKLYLLRVPDLDRHFPKRT